MKTGPDMCASMNKCANTCTVGCRGEEGRMGKRLSSVIFPRGKQVWLSVFFSLHVQLNTRQSVGGRVRSGDLLGLSIQLCGVFFVVLAAAGVKSVPVHHLFLVYDVCLILSQVVPVLYLVLYHCNNSGIPTTFRACILFCVRLLHVIPHVFRISRRFMLVNAKGIKHLKQQTILFS